MLRIVVATFFVTLYIASLAIFLVAFNCNWVVSSDDIDNPRYHVHAFPDVGA